MDAEELFASLKPRPGSYSGAYNVFVADELPERLRPEDFPAALAWVEQRQSRHELPLEFEWLMDKIMRRAWDHLDVPGVREAYARAALARLRRSDEIARDREDGTFTGYHEPSFRGLIADDDEKRRALVEKMLDVLQDDGNDTIALVHSNTPLVLAKDMAWLLENLEAAASKRRRAALAALIELTFYRGGDEQHELVYLAYEKNSALADEIGRFFDPISCSSEKAKRYRRRQEELRRQREQREESSNSPPAEMVIRALEDFEAGNTDAFWQGVVLHMQFDESGYFGASPAHWDLTVSPGWQDADGTTRDRIVEAAKLYVTEGDPQTDQWLPHRNVRYDPAMAGCQALSLLAERSPHFLAELSSGVWKRWAPAILDHPIATGTGEEGPFLELVAMVYDNVPDAVIDTVLLLIDRDNAVDMPPFVLARLKMCWDDRLASALMEKAEDRGLKPPCFERLLEDLLDHDVDGAAKVASDAITEASDVDEDLRRRALVAARVLMFKGDNVGWTVVWTKMQEDAEFGRELMESVASDARHLAPQSWLLERQVADLYLWLVEEYPPAEYYLSQLGGSVSLKETLALWQDAVLSDLRDRGTVEACRQIQRVAEKRPDLWDSLKWTLYAAGAETRRRTWLAPRAEQVLDLVAKRGTRLVQNGDQLLEVVIESLRRLEAKLQSETPAAPDLWNKRDDGTYRPKDEEAFSDYVKRHLQEDLQGKGVVVNREVVIRRGEGKKGRGERTDVHVDAVLHDPRVEESDTVTIIVEAKGCWYQKLYKEIEAQLVGRYLRDNRCRHGLYLVGWFNCPQWDPKDSRHKTANTAARRDRDQVQKKLEAQALLSSEGNLHVRAMTLNAALR